MRRFFLTLALVLFLPFVFGAGSKGAVLLSGKTMGTTYHISVVADHAIDPGKLAGKIEQRLAEINQSMSTYLPQSEIRRFNRLRQTSQPFCPSGDFFSVMQQGEALYRLTDGAWDGTILPIVELWGFGRSRQPPAIPPMARIESLRARVGFDLIEISQNGCMEKRHPQVSVDLASIAKGFGVDAVSGVIAGCGFDNFLVEIGGEVRAQGVRKDGKPWRIGINTPRDSAGTRSVYKAVSLRNRALATSGSYRNFFKAGGRTYSHVVDPRTGYPVDNGVVSVSVIAGNCTFADGLATAVMVLGRRKGLALIDRLAGVEGLVVVQDRTGKLTDYFSSGFPLE